jgi:transposase
MAEKKTRRRFDRDFKKEAVRLSMESGRSLASVARELGIHENLLYKWRRQLLDKANEAFPGKGRLSPKDNEVYKLRKELADVKEERDILKKALAIFSKKPK